MNAIIKRALKKGYRPADPQLYPPDIRRTIPKSYSDEEIEFGEAFLVYTRYYGFDRSQAFSRELVNLPPYYTLKRAARYILRCIARDRRRAV